MGPVALWLGVLLAEPAPPAAAPAPDRVELKGGGVLEGEIVRRTPDQVVLRTAAGEFTFKAEDVASVRRGRPSPPPSPGPAAGPAAGPKPPDPLLPADRILAAMKSPFPREFEEALASVPWRRAEVVPGLLAVLRAGDSLARTRAARALAHAADPGTARALSQALGDPWPPVREWAATGLGRLGQAGVGPLSEGLGRNPQNPAPILRALGDTGSPDAAPPILAYFLGRDAPARGAARREAERAAREALKRLGPDAVPALVQALSHEALVPLAAPVLGALKDPSAAGPLGRALFAAPAGARGAVVAALAEVRGPEALEALARAASSEEPALREAALAALERPGDRAGAAVLAGIADDPASPVRVRAALAAWRAGEDARAIELLGEILRTAPRSIRIDAARALGETGAAAAVPFLESGASSPERDVADACRAALARIRGGR